MNTGPVDRIDAQQQLVELGSAVLDLLNAVPVTERGGWWYRVFRAGVTVVNGGATPRGETPLPQGGV